MSAPDEANLSSSASSTTDSTSFLDPIDLASYQNLTGAPQTHPNHVSSHRRARELYQYFHPTSFEEQTGENLLLATQAQLTAIRLGGKCMINFLDNARQYIIAEAEAEDPTAIDAVLEEAAAIDPKAANTTPSKWFECRVGTRYQSICNYTIEIPEVSNNSLPIFEVPNLVEDVRFKNIPIVAGEPHLRYYCGTPLYTKSGIAIGALVVVDTKPRPPIGKAQQEFIRKIARNIVSILELHKDSQQQRRTTSMNRCLSRFVDPLDQATRSRSKFPSTPDLRSTSKPDSLRSIPLNPPEARPEFDTIPENPTGQKGTTDQTNEADDDRDTIHSQDDNLPDVDTTGFAPFPEAADLLREALGVDTCGVAFLDTVSISSPPLDSAGSRDSSSDTTRSRFQSGGSSPVLACSFNPAHAQPDTKTRRRLSTPLSFLPLPVNKVVALGERYPSGQLWIFDGEGEPCYDSPPLNAQDDRLDMGQLREDGIFLLRHIPQASCIFLKSIWNARSHRMVVAVAYSSSPYQTFTIEHDVPFINAFCNCVTVDLVRLAALSANQQKGDFIGSISHELRSPLHGILASCDLLEDTSLSPSQQSLVETANSCGRTLLDTISMVLDWSKVNAFERDWRKVQSSKHSRSSAAIIKADPNGQRQLLPNLYGNVDLAAVVEEVVEGAVIGQTFQSIQTAVDFADLGAQARGRSIKGRKSDAVTRPTVEVFVDIKKAPRDWVYLTQPGAFRRCIMNLVGNSLKYTTSGWVRVTLQVTPGSTVEASEPSRDTVTLIVEDTGKGISSQYLRTKLFSPFAQESVLAPGTGLGLSLTKSIIDMLDGEIGIESSVGQGTKVSVKIPMMPRDAAFQKQTTSERTTPTTAGTGSSDSDNDVRAVQELSHGRRWGYFSVSSEASSDSERVQMMQVCLSTYLQDWFDIALVEDWRTNTTDLLMVNDYDVPALVELLEASKHPYPSAILVFCTNASQFSGPRLSRTAEPCIFHALSKPFGPHRLAKCLQACFKTTQSPSELSQTSEGTIEGSATVPNASGLLSPTLRHDLIRTYSKPDVTYNGNSLNATLALTTPPSTSSTLLPLSTSPATSLDEFPFPGQEWATSAAKAPVSQEAVDAAKEMQEALPTRIPRTQALQMTDRAASDGPAPNTKRMPRLLLVDDNNINLKLLSTYMKKLKYTDVATASDGRQAADMFKAAIDSSTPPDVIFMDLSMPVLDGFEATREIRAMEKAFMDVLPALATPSPALIIALSGLASETDQDRAFEAGVDLFMTKPASFKEVGTLLKTWEANGGVEGSDQLPHGAVSGGIPIREAKE